MNDAMYVVKFVLDTGKLLIYNGRNRQFFVHNCGTKTKRTLTKPQYIVAEKRCRYHILWYQEKTPSRAGLKSDSIKTRIETSCPDATDLYKAYTCLKSDSIKTRIETVNVSTT